MQFSQDVSWHFQISIFNSLSASLAATQNVTRIIFSEVFKIISNRQ